MIVLRADGNSKIGSGHVMRCLSIAKEASKLDNVLFLSADENFENTINSVDIAFRAFNTRYDQLEDELPKLRKLLVETAPSALFIDSYFVTRHYLFEVKKVCDKIGCKLVYLDDLISFPYACDYLINYNIFGLDNIEDYRKLYQKEKLPRLLLGPQYAPLRNEFANLPFRTVKKQVEDILISTGGADSEHIAYHLVKRILDGFMPYKFHIIIGIKNNDLGKIEKLINDSKSTNVVLHRNVKHMAELMNSCDIAVSAAGSTLYELCATQTPTLTYVLADNQISGAQGFDKHSIGIYIGDYRYKTDFWESLFRELDVLANNADLRKRLAINMKKVVDGNGSYRILKEVLTD